MNCYPVSSEISDQLLFVHGLYIIHSDYGLSFILLLSIRK